MRAIQRPLETFDGLTDVQWQSIVTLVGLSPDARAALDHVIERYRSDKKKWPRQRRLAQTRSHLAKLAKRAQTLGRSIDKLDEEDKAALGWACDLADVVGYQKDARDVVLGLAVRARTAANGVASEKNRDYMPPLHVLVGSIDEILFRSTGRRIQRSYKRNDKSDFVDKVCSIADPQIGKGSIDEAKKATTQLNRMCDKLRGEMRNARPV
jgi:hypothetical protein